MILSFDFDGSLSRPSVQNECKLLIKAGHEVHVVTQRTNGDERFYEVTDRLGIPGDRIHFTNMVDKWTTLNDIGADVHYDNDPLQIRLIKKHCPKTYGVLI